MKKFIVLPLMAMAAISSAQVAWVSSASGVLNLMETIVDNGNGTYTYNYSLTNSAEPLPIWWVVVYMNVAPGAVAGTPFVMAAMWAGASPKGLLEATSMPLRVNSTLPIRGLRATRGPVRRPTASGWARPSEDSLTRRPRSIPRPSASSRTVKAIGSIIWATMATTRFSATAASRRPFLNRRPSPLSAWA